MDVPDARETKEMTVNANDCQGDIKGGRDVCEDDHDEGDGHEGDAEGPEEIREHKIVVLAEEEDLCVEVSIYAVLGTYERRG